MPRRTSTSFVDHPPHPTEDSGPFTLEQGEDAVYVLAGLFNQQGMLGPVLRMALYDIENHFKAIKCSHVHRTCPIHASNHETPCPTAE